MNKKILIGILILIFSVATVAFAFEIATSISQNETQYISSDNIDEIDFEKVVSSSTSKARNADSFSSIVNCGNEAKRNNISSYISFVSSHSFNDEQLSVIGNVLDNGTTIQSLIQVYDFWLTTDEPFSIIADICELEDKYFNLYWYEDAFNKLTDNSHGVMEPDDIKLYNQKGISNEHIMCANILSRKKGQNIYDILDSVVEGKSLEKIACDIYDVDYFEKSDNLHEDILLFCRAKAKNISASSDYKSVLESYDNNCQLIAQIKTEQTLKLLDVDSSDTSDDTYKSMIDLPGYIVRTCYSKGYTYEEIYLASALDGSNILSQLKRVREGMRND